MARDKVDIDGLANAVIKGLEEYRGLTDDALDEAVKKTAETVKEEIRANAPKHTGKHSRTWSERLTLNNSHTKVRTVYARTPRGYALAHLLENGHVTRSGGHVTGRPYIAPAEQHGEEMIENEIKRSIGGN